MTTFQRTITNTNDDAHERDDGTGFSSSANPMLLRAHGTAASRSHVGLRFPNVTIPQGATINSATVTIDIVGTASDDIDATIWGNDVDNAADFVSEADVTSRTKTAASVSWTQASAGAGAEVSPDITSIIQEIVDRGSFASGNAICILLFGDNAATSATTLDDGTATGAILDIDYVGADYTLTAAPGDVSIVGGAAALEASRVLTAAAGAISLVGGAANLTLPTVATAIGGFMRGLALQVAEQRFGKLIADFTGRAYNLSFETGEHGFARMLFSVRALRDEAFHFYESLMGRYCSLAFGGIDAYAGRVEDIALASHGIDVVVFGYWRALTDTQYRGIWSTQSVSKFTPVTEDEVSTRAPHKYEMDTNNRIYITPKKNETYADDDEVAELHYQSPQGRIDALVEIEFDYDVKVPTDWIAGVSSYDDGYFPLTQDWTVAGDGTQKTGSATVTLTNTDMVGFHLFNSTGVADTITEETGAWWAKFTAIRIKGTASATVDSDEIVEGVLAYATAKDVIEQISSSVAAIEDSGQDIAEAEYSGVLAADIITDLARRGNSSDEVFETGVYEQQLLYFRPKSSQAMKWFVDAADLRVAASLDRLANTVLAYYRDESGFEKYSSQADTLSILTLYGFVKYLRIDVPTTSSTEASDEAAAQLAELKTVQPTATLSISAMYDVTGARYPLWMARAGDLVTIRNLPPVVAGSLDRVRTFRLAATIYNAANDLLLPIPEFDPDLAAELGRTQQAASKGGGVWPPRIDPPVAPPPRMIW